MKDTKELKKDMSDRFILIASDDGASKKIYKVAEKIGYKGDIIVCSKSRDNEGILSKTFVPIFDLSKDIIIIDDIFDYGTTFKNIAGIMNDMGHKGKKYLICTHSIQQDGIADAFKWFDNIYTTNSYKNWEDFNKSESFHKFKDRLKVLNIF